MVSHQSFCYLAEAGRYEKCKKHTFLALITIFLKNAINKNCSEFNKKMFWENFFSRNSGSGFWSGLYIFRIFGIFWIYSVYKTFVSKNFQIISNSWFIWTGMYYITSPLCRADLEKICISKYKHQIKYKYIHLKKYLMSTSDTMATY